MKPQFMRLGILIIAMIFGLGGCGTSSATPPSPAKNASSSSSTSSSPSSSDTTKSSATSASTSGTVARSEAVTRKIQALNEEISRKQDTLTIDQSEVASLISIRNQSGLQSIASTVATDPATIKNADFWGFLDGLQKGNYQNAAVATTNAATSAAKVAADQQVQASMTKQIDTLNAEIQTLHTDIANLQSQLLTLIKSQSTTTTH